MKVKDSAKNKLHNYIEATNTEIKNGKSVYQAIKTVGKRYNFSLDGKTAEFLFNHYK